MLDKASRSNGGSCGHCLAGDRSANACTDCYTITYGEAKCHCPPLGATDCHDNSN